MREIDFVVDEPPRVLGFFERYLTIWVFLCIIAGMALGKVVPELAGWLMGFLSMWGKPPLFPSPLLSVFFS